jgi:hypothetical protein
MLKDKPPLPTCDGPDEPRPRRPWHARVSHALARMLGAHEPGPVTRRKLESGETDLPVISIGHGALVWLLWPEVRDEIERGEHHV